MDCVVCQREFEVKRPRKGYKPKLCSRACIGEFNRQRISGTRDENLWEKIDCKQCGKEIERLKSRTKREFCSRNCRTKFIYPKLLSSPKGRSWKIIGENLVFRSRLEAAFVKDFLRTCELEWEYEPKTFVLPDGRKYTPDFYVKDNDCYVEIKGHRWKTAEKANLLRNQGINIVYADGDVLESVYGLNLDNSYLKSFVEKANRYEDLS